MSSTHRLANATNRPVQLHLPDGVMVIPAFGVVDAMQTTLDEGQVQVLCRNGVLNVLPGTEPPAQPVQTAAPRSGRRAMRERAAKQATNQETSE